MVSPEPGTPPELVVLYNSCVGGATAALRAFTRPC